MPCACIPWQQGGEGPMNACELTASITAVANLLASKLSDEELTLLGSVLTQLADTLFTISAYREKFKC